MEPAYDVAGAALNALDAEEQARVESAAREDPALQRELDELRAVASELAALVPAVTLNRGRSAGIRSRLVARAGSSQEGRPPGRGATPADVHGAGATPRDPVREMPRRNRRRREIAAGVGAARRRPSGTVHTARAARAGMWHVAGWLAAAAVLLALVLGGVRLWPVLRDQGPVALGKVRGGDTGEPGATRARGAAAAGASDLAAQVATLRAQLAGRDSVIAMLTGARTRVVDLAAYTGQAAGPAARLFWDPQSNDWMMFARNLRRPGPGRTYQLWLIARGQPAPISAGTFEPDASGSAVMRARYSLAPGTLRRVAVTEEPTGGMPAPTGQVVLAGATR